MAYQDAFDRLYRVGPCLGKGGFGVVYAGIRTRDELPVAIKHISKHKISDMILVSCISITVRTFPSHEFYL